MREEAKRKSQDHINEFFNEIEYPKDITDVKKYLLHLDEGLCDQINEVNKNLQDILGYSMYRLMNEGQSAGESVPQSSINCDNSEIIQKSHTVTCCADKYTLAVYMKEREQVRAFLDWFKEITHELVTKFEFPSRLSSNR